ncbi:MAG: hypothetical protein GQ558_03720 [Thermoplasmata archaeon]|nr:hypothetical protein [Thermoplasmata archaeon]
MVEARCPVCGKLYEIAGSGNPRAVEGHFLKHKDNCNVPRPGEFVRVVSSVVLVLDVDGETEEFPLLEVEYPSGRKGIYRLAHVGRVRDQGQAAEKYVSMGGKV